MRGSQIKLNEEYAVRIPENGMKRSLRPITKALVVDKRNNGAVVVSYPGHKCLNRATSPLSKPPPKWVPARTLVVIKTCDFIARWCDWEPPGVPDGRPASEREHTYSVGGVAVTQPGLVAS